MAARLLLRRPLSVLLGCVLVAGPALAAEPAVVRWQPSLSAFAAADAARRPEAGGVLFVGSSSIRMWSRLADDFPQAQVLNRGFGGSTMADCAALVGQLVLPYRPRQVLVYAGDNDLAEGRTPQQVLESFQAFVQAVRAQLPGVRIGYIAVKPSPARVQLLAQARETNRLLADWLAGLPDASYIDVHTPMLDGEGRPRAELYGPDGLHMNAEGYALWRRLIATHVVATQPTAQLSAPPR